MENDHERRARKTDQIRKLLDLAEKNPYSEEAAAARLKADQLQLAYSISEREIQLSRPQEHRETPEERRTVVVPEGSTVKRQLIELHFECITNSRCRAVYSGLDATKREGAAHSVGFPTDLDYAEMLYGSLRLQMANELVPMPDPSLPFIDNLVRMKEAGMKWEDIYPLLAPLDPQTPNNTWHRPTCVRWGAEYTAFCKEVGRKQNRAQPITYQRNFANGFVSEVRMRFSAIIIQRQRAEANERERGGSGMDLVIRDMRKEVDEMYNRKIGKARPAKQQGGKYDSEAAYRGQEAGRRADLGTGGSVNRGSGPRELT